MAASSVSGLRSVEVRLLDINGLDPTTGYVVIIEDPTLRQRVGWIISSASMNGCHSSFHISGTGSSLEAIRVTVIRLNDERVDSRAQRIQDIFDSQLRSTPPVTFTDRPTVGRSSLFGLTLEESANGQWKGTWSEIVKQKNSNPERPHGRLLSSADRDEKTHTLSFPNGYKEALEAVEATIVVGGIFEPDPTLEAGSLEVMQQNFRRLIEELSLAQDAGTPADEMIQKLSELTQVMQNIYRAGGTPPVDKLPEMLKLAKLPLPPVMTGPCLGLSFEQVSAFFKESSDDFQAFIDRKISELPPPPAGATDQEKEAFSSQKGKLEDLARQRREATDVVAQLEEDVKRIQLTKRELLAEADRLEMKVQEIYGTRRALLAEVGRLSRQIPQQISEMSNQSDEAPPS